VETILKVRQHLFKFTYCYYSIEDKFLDVEEIHLNLLSVVYLQLLKSDSFFFTDHQLYGAKALDFHDFCKGINIINEGGY